MGKRFNINEYVDGILNGNRILLSQAITLIESSKIEDVKLGQELIEKISSYAGNSKRIGITGAPGVGKSTFIESFGKLLTSIGHKVAVLTIDPSSQKSKGSILGDKTRMEHLSVDPFAYIRPSASGNSLGGVTCKTREAILLCEAAGFNIIIIETVGVGQSEVEVKNMTDIFILLLLAGAGDELQGIKKGIMEMADIIAITKADGDNKINAVKAKMECENALHLLHKNENNWTTIVNTCSSLDKESIRQIWDVCEDYFMKIKSNGFFDNNRVNQNKEWLNNMINQRVLNSFYNNEKVKKKLSIAYKKLDNSPLSISKLVDEIFSDYK